jgi:regulator of cell morphogenesis and NO signaling
MRRFYKMKSLDPIRAPLQQLKDEHVLLRAEMDLFYDVAEEIEYESGAIVLQLFERLQEQVSSFTSKLKEHSKREEDGLFPMINRHPGEHAGLIDRMEMEHEKAEQHLQDFLAEAEQAGSNIDDIDAQTIAVHAIQAYATLTQHFAKEEKVLFPLAEQLLLDDEMEELERLIKA